jgi:hypothetical protein
MQLETPFGSLKAIVPFPHTSRIILFPIYTFDSKQKIQRLKTLENIDVVRLNN